MRPLPAGGEMSPPTGEMTCEGGGEAECCVLLPTLKPADDRLVPRIGACLAEPPLTAWDEALPLNRPSDGPALASDPRDDVPLAGTLLDETGALMDDGLAGEAFAGGSATEPSLMAVAFALATLCRGTGLLGALPPVVSPPGPGEDRGGHGGGGMLPSVVSASSLTCGLTSDADCGSD